MAPSRANAHPTYEDRIVVDPAILVGKPVVKGTRISVELIARYFKMGESPDDIILMYPHLKTAAVYDAISYYLDHQEEMEREMTELDEEMKDIDGYMQKLGFERLQSGGYRPVGR